MSHPTSSIDAETLVKQCLLHLNMDMPSDTNFTPASDNFGIKQLYAFVDDAGQEMAARGPWRGLLRVGGIESAPTNDGRHVADYPSDYHALQEDGSMIDLDTRNVVQVWKEAGTWEALKSAALAGDGPGDLEAFLDYDGITFNKPANVRIRYYSTQWVVSTSDVLSDKVSAGNDKFLLPVVCLRYGVLYRWRRAQGQDYADFQSQYEALVDSEFRSSRNLEPEDGG